MTMLVVDDDSLVTTRMALALAKLGHHDTVTAQTGAQTLLLQTHAAPRLATPPGSPLAAAWLP